MEINNLIIIRWMEIGELKKNDDEQKWRRTKIKLELSTFFWIVKLIYIKYIADINIKKKIIKKNIFYLRCACRSPNTSSWSTQNRRETQLDYIYQCPTDWRPAFCLDLSFQMAINDWWSVEVAAVLVADLVATVKMIDFDYQMHLCSIVADRFSY